jgi:outer membrane protein assembly factor BamB
LIAAWLLLAGALAAGAPVGGTPGRDDAAVAPAWGWVDRFGGRGRDAPRAVAFGAAGEVYSTGQLAHGRAADERSWSGDASRELMFLARHERDGRRAWLLRFGGSPLDEPRALAVAADGTVLVAGLSIGELGFGAGSGLSPLRSVGGADAFLLAVGSDGEARWALRWGGKHADVARAVAVDGQGNVYVAGTFQLTADFDPGPGRRLMTSAGRTDAFVLKLDPARRLLWARSFGGREADEATTLAVGADGTLYVGGRFEGRAWDGDGKGGAPLSDGAASFVAALAPDGTRRWLRRLDGLVAGVAAGPQGTALAAGSFQGDFSFEGRKLLDNPAGADLFAMRLGREGEPLWARDVGVETGRWLTGEAVAATHDGLLLIGGSLQGSVDFDPGAGRVSLVAETTAGFVLALDAAGAIAWARQPAASGFSQVLALAASTGRVAVVGVSHTDTSFQAARSSGTSPPPGKSDVFVLELELVPATAHRPAAHR